MYRFERILQSYTRLLRSFKYPVQMISGAVIWGSGDILCQKIVDFRDRVELNDKHNNIDWKRVSQMTIYGSCFSAPIYTFWYSYLESLSTKWIGTRKYKYGSKLIFKTLMDTVIFDSGYLLFFFLVNSLMQGKGVGGAKEKVYKEFQSTYITNFMVWCPIQSINFGMIPVLYQPLFAQTCNIGWNAYLSFVQHKPN
jgi:protein Mpv17